MVRGRRVKAPVRYGMSMAHFAAAVLATDGPAFQITMTSEDAAALYDRLASMYAPE